MRRGFTLIETVVVLLVLALVAGVAAPAIGRGLDAIALRTEVAGIASFLRAARAQAIARRRSVEVRIDRDGHTLVRQDAADGRSAADGGTAADGGSAADGENARAGAAVHHLSSRLRLTADGPADRPVTFFAHGLSSGARLLVDSPDAGRFVVTVDPLTGRVATRRGQS